MSDKPSRYFDLKLGAWVTRLPDGEALGARDLQNWSRRRSRGMSGSDGWKERKAADDWRDGKRSHRRPRFR